MARPYVVLSCAASLDGYLDDAGADRLILSNDADLDRVDGVRAGSDAILVGAGTLRADDPRLLVRSPARRAERMAQGRPPSPLRVILTGRGDLDPSARLFSTEGADRVVYCATSGVDRALAAVGEVAAVVDAGEPVDLDRILADLAERSVARLLVEGGGRVLTQFLTAGLVDELHLVLAPFFIGTSVAPRFVHDGQFRWSPAEPARLLEARPIGDVVLLRYGRSAPSGVGQGSGVGQ